MTEVKTKRQSASLDRRKLLADPIMVTTIVVLIAFLTLFILYPLAILLVDSFYSKNGLTLDIYHTSGGNLAVVGDGRSHIAVMAGSTALSAPVAVDVLCAAGALSDSVQPAAILTTASSPRWLDQPGVQQVYYGQDIPFIQLRPGRSLQIKEAERVALQ